MKCSFGISSFLEEISSLSHSIVFLFLCIVHLRRLSYLLLFSGTLHSVGYIFPFMPWFLLFFSAICKASSDNHFAFLLSFSWGWFWSLPPVQCYEPLSIVLQALCLSDLIPWICHIHCITVKDLIKVIPKWPSGFPYFLDIDISRIYKELNNLKTS